MFYKAIKEGLIDPKRSVQVGIRTWNDDFMGMNVLGADRVHANGPQAAVVRILEIVGNEPSYLTFDIDCLDPAFAPGTGTPVAGGVSSAQAFAILRGLVPVRIVGMDVVEVAPSYDHAEITAIAAAHMAAEMLCVLAAQRSAADRLPPSARVNRTAHPAGGWPCPSGAPASPRPAARRRGRKGRCACRRIRLATAPFWIALRFRCRPMSSRHDDAAESPEYAAPRRGRSLARR